MPRRKTTDFGALFESLMENLQVHVAASVDRTLSDFSKRLTRIERRLDALDPGNSSPEVAVGRRSCSLCERPAVARSMCSAHYQQWRYRQRKSSLIERVRQQQEQGATEESTADDSSGMPLKSTQILGPFSPLSGNN